MQPKNSSGNAPPKDVIKTLLEHFGQGRLALAEEMASAMTAKFPAFPFGWKALGTIRYQLGRASEALEPLRRAAQLLPADAEVRANLGNTLLALGTMTEAATAFRDAIRVDPHYAIAHSNLGHVLLELGQPVEAESCCQHALHLQPAFAPALNNLGNAQKALGQYAAAEASYRQALVLTPAFADALCNLAIVLYEQNRLTEAEGCFRQTLQIAPQHALALNNLGVTLQAKGLLDEALACYRAAVGLKPDYAEAHSNLLLCLNYQQDVSPEEALAAARSFGEHCRALATPYAQWRCPQQPKVLNVGFVSGDFKNHPVGYFLEGLLRCLDPARFNLFAYPTSAQADELTARIRPCFSAWTPLYGLSDQQAAARIHQDGVHVLIDLSGHSALNRLPVFAYKPAPVQLSWLGYFATTGLPTMDYVLTSATLVPPAEEWHFCERIWRLPDTALCFTAPVSAPPVAALPALANGFITFGCFNNFSKVNQQVLAAWIAILQQLPDSRLLLKARQLADPAVTAAVRQAFSATGIAQERLLLEGYSSRTDYLQAYDRVDIALDPFPFPGGTTTVESLWMGVPVLTLRGNRLIARQGEALAVCAGLPQWIADDVPAYIAQAQCLAADVAKLAHLRQALRPQVVASPLFDAQRFAANFGEALWGMWKNSGF